MISLTRASSSAPAAGPGALAADGPGVVVQRGDSLHRIAAEHGVSLQALLAANPQLRNPDVIYPGMRLQLPDTGRYVVRPGDTLHAIARELGVSQRALQAANPQLRNPDVIHVGDSLRLPAQRGASAPAPQPPAAGPGLLARLAEFWSLLPLPTHPRAPATAPTAAPRREPAAPEAARPAAPAGAAGFEAHNARDRRWLAQRDTLVDAARRADVDPGVVAMIANFESGFRTDARPVARDASRNTVRQFDGTMALSTAHGLGQFTDGTWRQMLRTHGAEYGIADAATLTTAEANAHRNDAGLQAAMLAEFTHDNVATGRRLGGADDVANVYALHNLGGGDGATFLRALAADPTTRVDDVLSNAVIRNNSSLYGDGSITVQAAYERMGDAMRAGQRYADDARQPR
ncbi:LysM peptidoglycan-binding domain-containing protein [Roseateles sp. DXS20W]|uniref:LysM peptidoglycan-binding domain-containing protein n=1 Tax=Pelomonas lactea TaxID=3299030 RepID=A0ABW7GFW7_9BURK